MEKETMRPVNQYLSFFVAGDEYAIGIEQIKEIIECAALTKVPGAPRWIRGVLNLRGAVVPVVDLALKFGLAQTEITRRTCVVIVEVRTPEGQTVVGVMADAVDQVLELAPDSIQAPPSLGLQVRTDCVIGMGDSNGKFVVLLNIDCVLSSSELLAIPDAVHPDHAEPAPLVEEVSVA